MGSCIGKLQTRKYKSDGPAPEDVSDKEKQYSAMLKDS